MRARYATTLVVAVLASPSLAAGQEDLPLSPLTFDAALQYAATHNPAVAAARLGRAVRESAVRAAGQRPNPEVGAEVTRDSPHQTVTLGVPIELGTQRRRRIDMAREELSLSDLDVKSGLRDMRRQVREHFFALVAADERVRIATAVVDIATRVREAASLRFEAGAVPRLDVMQADLGVARAIADLEGARNARRAAQALLDAVLNLPPQHELTLTGSLGDHTAAPAYDNALAIASASNTDMAGLDAAIAIEMKRLDLLRAQRTPVPVFSVAGMFHSPGDFTVGPSASVAVGVPLFSRNQGEIAASIATAAQLRAQREATRRTVENAVFAATTRVDAARRQVDTYNTRLLPVATELQALSEESYQAGRTSVLGLLDAQRNLRDISRDAVQAALDLQMALAELEDLLGAPLP